MFNKEIYIKRREKLMEQVGSGFIVLLGNEESSMNYKDNHYPFRQDTRNRLNHWLQKLAFRR